MTGRSEEMAEAKLWTPGQEGAPLAPPGFVPNGRIIGARNYILDHPTRYRWQKHVEPLIRYLYREMGGPSQIHINTYVWHPPYNEYEGILKRYDTLSFDVWGPYGRGAELGFDKGQKAVSLVWDYPGEPYIDWYIWQRYLFWRGNDFVPTEYGDDPFSWHEDHVHFTFLPRGVI